MSRRRQETLARWNDHTYDVLVVGGGITGAGIARDAAMRGLSCALVDKSDFAAGTSSKSGKLVHGGLRYLKYGQIRMVREACRERWLLLTRVAPHIVRPVRFVVPFYRINRTPRWMMSLGVALYDLLALGRNTERFRLHSAAKLAQLEPSLTTQDCLGGLSYADCACLDFRLVIDTLKSAAEHGASLVNYAELLELRGATGQFEATIRDVLAGTQHTLGARSVINAAGPWADDVQERIGSDERFGMKLSLGIHLVVSAARLPVRQTLALEVGRDGRMIYVVPWGDSILVGTTDTFYSGDKDHLAVTAEATEYLLDTVNRYFPGASLTGNDILSSFAGVRPLIGSDQGRREEQVSRDYQVSVRDDGVIAVTGGKLTTYRAIAERVVDTLVARFFPDRPRPCRTIAPISGGEAALPSGPSDRLRALWSRYGSNALQIEALIDQRSELAEPIDPRAPFLLAEVVYAQQHEFVETVDDMVDRRLGAFLCAPSLGLREKLESWLRDVENASLLAHNPRSAAE